MMSTLGRSLGGRLSAGLAVCALLWGCANAQPTAPTIGAKPAAPSAGVRPSITADSATRLTVTREGQFSLLQPDGRPLPECQFCTPALEQKYGKGCTRGVLVPPLCTGTTGGTVTSVDQLSVIQTKSNPTCITYYFMGRMYQGPCYPP